MYLLWPYAQIFTLLGNLRNYGGNICIVPETLDVGTCKPIQECQIANELVEIGLTDLCKTYDGSTNICCPAGLASITHRPEPNFRNPISNKIGPKTKPSDDDPVDEKPEESLENRQDSSGRTGRPTSKWPANKDNSTIKLLDDESSNDKDNVTEVSTNDRAETVTNVDPDSRPPNNDSSLPDVSELESKTFNSDMKTSATEYPKFTQKCTDKNTDRPGVCKPFDDCPSSTGQTDDVTLCGFAFDVPTICCAEETIIDEDVIIFPSDDLYDAYGFKSRSGGGGNAREITTQTQDLSKTRDKINTDNKQPTQ